jgi:hypothetical protein
MRLKEGETSGMRLKGERDLMNKTERGGDLRNETERRERPEE